MLTEPPEEPPADWLADDPQAALTKANTPTDKNSLRRLNTDATIPANNLTPISFY
jgi:hypothetical protein